MNAKKTPLQQVNEDHGGKNKLVDVLLGLVDHGDEDADALKARLLKASNKKLLRLQSVAKAIKDKFPALVPATVPAGWTITAVSYQGGVWKLVLSTPTGATAGPGRARQVRDHLATAGRRGGGPGTAAASAGGTGCPAGAKRHPRRATGRGLHPPAACRSGRSLR